MSTTPKPAAHARAIRNDWPEHFKGIAPLATNDIDKLCERLNTK